MASGFIGGFVRGTILGLCGISAVSIYYGWQPIVPEPESTILDVPAGSEFNQSREDTAVVVPQPLESPVLPNVPTVVVPAIETPAATTDLSTDAPSVPVTGDAAPQAPAAEPVIVSPDVGLPQPEFGITPPTLPNADLRPTMPRAETGVPLTDGPTQPVLGDDHAVPQTPPIDQGDVEIPQDPEPAPSVFDPQTPKTFDSDALATPLPKIGVPSNNGPALQSDTVSVPELPAPLGRAIDLYAAQTVETSGKPMLSFVVMTNPDAPIDPALIEALPFPIAFAVDPTSQFARNDLDTLRSLGQDVVALVDLAQGATVQDTEITIASVLNQLPSTVAIMEKTEGGLQVSRESNIQVPEILSRTGHGVLVYEKGLTSILREADKLKVTSTSIYKDLDGQGQTDRIIKRFLDGAVMRASSSDAGAVVVARLTPDTISTLLMWGFQDRATRVAIVPISQLLKASGDR